MIGESGKKSSLNSQGADFEYLYAIEPFDSAICPYMKLREDYQGAAFQAKNTSTGISQDIGFNGPYLNQADLTTLVGANDGKINIGYDQGPDVTDWYETDEESKPSIVVSGAIQEIASGVPCIDFSADKYRLRHYSNANGQPNTVAFLYKKTALGKPGNLRFFSQVGSGSAFCELRVDSDGDIGVGAGKYEILYTESLDIVLITILFNGNNSKVRKDGEEIFSGDLGSNVTGGLNLGRWWGEYDIWSPWFKLGMAVWYKHDAWSQIENIETYILNSLNT